MDRAFETNHGDTLVLDSDTNCPFHSFPSKGVFLAHFAFFRAFRQQEPMTNEGTAYICLYFPRHARPHYYCAKFMTVRCNQTCPSRALRALLFVSLKRHLNLGPYSNADRKSEQNSPNLLIWEQCVPFTDRNSVQNSPNLPI